MFRFLRPPSQLRLSVGVRQNTRCRIHRDAIAENTGPRQRPETRKKHSPSLKGSAEFQHNFTTVSVFRQSWHIHGNRPTPHLFFCSQYISAPANYQAGVTLQEWRLAQLDKKAYTLHAFASIRLKFRTWKANKQLRVLRLRDKLGLAVHAKNGSRDEDGYVHSICF